ncbi:MAG: hypothetical protein VKO39_02250 [Cyanobacteriota bacterium]|nr:hypothetical protein [Cyanobacteriota bacterium]
MSQVILFGGDDGGGILITSNGVRRIPPFDPSIRLQLRGLSALLNGIRLLPNTPGEEMTTLVNRVSNIFIEQVEAVVGPLEGDNSLVYLDEDGGFTCGSTGRPPIPFPRHLESFPSFNDLIASNLLASDLVDFVSAASEQQLKIIDVLENPAAAASELDVQLAERTAQDLQRLAPSQLDRISDPVVREVVEFFHKVAEDGQFLSTWATRPYEVASRLDVELSNDALDHILLGRSSAITDPGRTAFSPIVAGVVVGVLIMLVERNAREVILGVRDSSGVAKF